MTSGTRFLISLTAAFFIIFPAGLMAYAGVTDAKYVWKAATLAPNKVGWTKLAKEILVPEYVKATEGDLFVKVYWGGIKGDEKETIRKMRAGELQVAGLTAQGAAMVCPEITVVQLPFLFRGYDEVDHVKEKMLPAFEAMAEENGFKLGLWIDQDFDQLYSTRWDFSKLEQFRMARFLAWYGPLEKELFKALGARSVPLMDLSDFGKATGAIRSGDVDSVIAPAMAIVGFQMYSKFRYVSPIKIRYSPGVAVVTLDAWNQLPTKYQERIWNGRKEISQRFVQAARRDNRRFLEAMIAYGVREVKMDPKDEKQIRDISRTVWDDMSGAFYPRELLDEILRHLAEFRERKTQP